MESTEWIDSWLRSFCGNSSGLLLALLLVCTAYLVDGSFNPFLYFRF